MREWILMMAVLLGLQAAGGTPPQEPPPAVIQPAFGQQEIPDTEKRFLAEYGRPEKELKGEYTDYHDYFGHIFGPDWYTNTGLVHQRPDTVGDTEQYRYFYNAYVTDCMGVKSRMKPFLEKHLSPREWGGLEVFEYGDFPYQSNVYIYAADDAAEQKIIRLLREEYQPTVSEQLGQVEVTIRQSDLTLQLQEQILAELERTLSPEQYYQEQEEYCETVHISSRFYSPKEEKGLPDKPYILVQVRLSIVDPLDRAERLARIQQIAADLIAKNAWEGKVLTEYDIEESPETNRPNPDT